MAGFVGQALPDIFIVSLGDERIVRLGLTYEADLHHMSQRNSSFGFLRHYLVLNFYYSRSFVQFVVPFFFCLLSSLFIY
jgi:hypothetical protein